jgi:cobalt-zinc-cadmium efflux system membrane fusion protein
MTIDNSYQRLLVAVLIMGLLSCGPRTRNTPSETQNNEGTNVEKEEGGAHGAVLTTAQFEALQMQLDTLSQRNMGSFVEANGHLEVPPQNEAIITTIIGANVVSIEVIEGEKVAKNGVVAYLSHPDIIQRQTEYATAYSNSLLLKKEYERKERLYGAGVVSGVDFERAESEYRVARARMDGLAAQLQQLNLDLEGIRMGNLYSRTALRSPIEGHVRKVGVKTGQYVAPQTNLFEIVNTDHVHADLMVFEKDIHKVAEGQKVRFKAPSLPDRELTAEIYSVGRTFEEAPQAVHVHAEIENREGALIPGMYIQGRIETANENTTALPLDALVADGGKTYAFRAERKGDQWSFVPTEIISGNTEGQWAAVRFLDPPAANTLFAQNNAHYLMAEMQKGDAEHGH